MIGLPIEVDPIMRASIDIAEDLPAPTHNDNVKRLGGAILIYAEKMEAPRLLAWDVVEAADRISDVGFGLRCAHSGNTHFLSSASNFFMRSRRARFLNPTGNPTLQNSRIFACGDGTKLEVCRKSPFTEIGMNISSAFAGQSLDEIKAALDGGTLTIYRWRGR